MLIGILHLYLYFDVLMFTLRTYDMIFGGMNSLLPEKKSTS